MENVPEHLTTEVFHDHIWPGAPLRLAGPSLGATVTWLQSKCSASRRLRRISKASAKSSSQLKSQGLKALVRIGVEVLEAGVILWQDVLRHG